MTDSPRAARRVVVIDDDRALCETLADGLRPRGLTVEWHTSATKGLAAILAHEPDAVLTDLKMRELTGLQVCEQVLASRPDVPVVVFTAFGDFEAAVAAIRAGAYDFLTKPLDLDVAALALRRAIDHHRLRQEVRRLRASTRPTADEGMIGQSRAIRGVQDLVRRVGPSSATVLITGESGTGKELVARALHQRSGRPREAFVALNCAAMPETLVESELFGHARGAFTDARSDRVGLLIQAEGGTLFLDEVGDLPPATQAKLLRVLQERKLRPVGGNSEVEVNVRVIAATNRDLEAAVEAGTFRPDLLYRLAVVPIHVPPLRVREDDVLLLAQAFVAEAAARAGKQVRGLSSPVARTLLDYPWPGNVRELENCLERAVILTAHDQVVMEDLPEKIRHAAAVPPARCDADGAPLRSMEEVERHHILRVLEEVDGNRTVAARILGFDRRTISRKLKAYGLADTPDDP